MTFSWNRLHNLATGRWKMPAGWILEYDSMPSGGSYFEKTSVPEYWKKTDAEIEEYREEWLRRRNTTFIPDKSRQAWQFSWQQFTLTDIHGKQLILRMDSQGHVTQLQKKQVTETYEVLTPA